MAESSTKGLGRALSENVVKSVVSDVFARLKPGTRRQQSGQRPFQTLQSAQDLSIPSQNGDSFDEGGRIFADSSPAKDIVLYRHDGIPIRLEHISGDTTMVLLADHAMSISPGFAHRIARRSESLGHGVHLIFVVEPSESSPTQALIDRNHRVATLSGGHMAPMLVSLDSRGHVFDVMSDSETIMNWLWNDPRPHSIRATGALSLDDLMA